MRSKESGPNGHEVTEASKDIAQENKRIFVEAFHGFVGLLQEIKKRAKDVNTLSSDASRSFGNFYSGIRELGLAVPFLLMSGDYQNIDSEIPGDRAIITTRITESNMSGALAIVDAFFPDLVNIYNHCLEYKEARIDGKMTEEEVKFKESIAQRVAPFEYFLLDPLQKRLNNIAEGEAIYTKEYLKTKEGRIAQIRFDLFRKYLGLEQYFETVSASKYRPMRESDKGAQYVEFVPSWIVFDILQKQKKGYFPVLEREYSDPTFDGLYHFVEEYGVFPTNDYTGQLGEYLAHVGFDEEKGERYVSYYDVWDVDPPQLKALDLDIDQFNFPFEIYGRIYQDDFNQGIKWQYDSMEQSL